MTALVPLPPNGRTFSATRRVRLGDVSPRGRLRLDAAARYLQDVSNDDVMEVGLEGAMAWVVRRTVVEVHRFPAFREDLTLTTWCSGTGGRWASRRIRVEGSEGGSIEADALWVHLDMATGRPLRLPDEFLEYYGEAAAGRTIRARLTHPAPPTSTTGSPFTLRFRDLDLLGHVNNAVYWEAVEEELAGHRELRAPLRATVEHPAATERDDEVEVLTAPDDGAGFRLWWLAGGKVAASAHVEPL